MEDKNTDNGMTRFIILSLSALFGLFSVTYNLLLQRMDKQEMIAASNISALREEIKTTKADAKDAVSAAALASKDAVAATASALRDSVNSTTLSSRDATNAIATALSDKIVTLSNRIDKLEDRMILIKR